LRQYFLFIACLVPILAQPPKPKHINRMIDVLEMGQPIYYDSSHEGGPSDMALSFGLPVRQPTLKEANDRGLADAKPIRSSGMGSTATMRLTKSKRLYDRIRPGSRRDRPQVHKAPHALLRTSMQRVIIRGDGIAAYCCAHLLKAAGIRVSLDQTEIESVQRGLEWCARQLRNRNEFRYRLDGFELQAVN